MQESECPCKDTHVHHVHHATHGPHRRLWRRDAGAAQAPRPLCQSLAHCLTLIFGSESETTPPCSLLALALVLHEAWACFHPHMYAQDWRTSAFRLVRNLASSVRKMEHDSCSAAGTALVLLRSRDAHRCWRMAVVKSAQLRNTGPVFSSSSFSSSSASTLPLHHAFVCGGVCMCERACLRARIRPYEQGACAAENVPPAQRVGEELEELWTASSG